MLKWFRQVHLYLGIFTAPALLFFAFSGALQTLGLNDASPDGYKPPHWLSVMAQIHKKQSPVLPQRRPQPQPTPNAAGPAPKKADVALQTPAPAPGAGQRDQHDQRPPKPIALKAFFLLVCASLLLSTFSGAYMGWKFKRNRIALTALFVAGIVVPLVLMKL